MAFRSIRSIGLEMEIVGNVYGAWQLHNHYTTSSRRINPGSGPKMSMVPLNSWNGKSVRLLFSYMPIWIDSSKWKLMCQIMFTELSCPKNKQIINTIQLVSCWNWWTQPNVTTEYLIRRLLQLWKDFRIGNTGLNEWNSWSRSSLTTRTLNTLWNLIFSIDDKCAGWSCWHTTTMRFTTDLVTRTAQLMLSPNVQSWNLQTERTISCCVWFLKLSFPKLLLVKWDWLTLIGRTWWTSSSLLSQSLTWTFSLKLKGSCRIGRISLRAQSGRMD